MVDRILTRGMVSGFVLGIFVYFTAELSVKRSTARYQKYHSCYELLYHTLQPEELANLSIFFKST